MDQAIPRHREHTFPNLSGVIRELVGGTDSERTAIANISAMISGGSCSMGLAEFIVFFSDVPLSERFFRGARTIVNEGVSEVQLGAGVIVSVSFSIDVLAGKAFSNACSMLSGDMWTPHRRILPMRRSPAFSLDFFRGAGGVSVISEAFQTAKLRIAV